MRPTLRTLPFVLVSVCTSLWAAPEGYLRISDRQRNELRGAVESHRAARRDEVQREDAAAGRRLTAAERLELREQLRRQWRESSGALHSAESHTAERMAPVPVADAVPSRPAARSQRP